MNIENEVIEFHPQCRFELLRLNELQLQYLADLRSQNSIQSMTERYLANGWLVNFQVLFDLIDMLVQHHWILNPDINEYFQRLQAAAPPEPGQVATSTAPPVAPSPAPAAVNVVNVKKKGTTESLLKLPFFRSLQPELAKFLLSQARQQVFATDQAVCTTGESSRDLYVLLKGQLGIFRTASVATSSVSSLKKQFVAILAENSVFGEAGFLLGERRTADVVALRTSEVLVIPYQADVLDQHLNRDKAQSLQQRFWVQHALLHSDFFKNTPADCLDALTFSGKIVNLQDQQVLFQQGQAGQSAYVVIQGSLLIVQNGKVINTLPQGSFVGEISLMLNDGHRTASAIAQRNTKLLEIQRPEFYRLLAKNLYLARELQILANQRLQKDSSRLG